MQICDINKRIIPYVVKITGGGHQGTGIFYRGMGKCGILTAAHVVKKMEAAEEIKLLFHYSNEQEETCYCEKAFTRTDVKLIHHKNYDGNQLKSYLYDVGMIELIIGEEELAFLPQYNVRILSHMCLKEDHQELFVTGYPQNNGEIENDAIPVLKPELIYISNPMEMKFSYIPPSLLLETKDFMPGYSGSGIFADYGEDVILIGLVSGTGYPESEQRYEEAAVSAKAIREFLENEGYLIVKDEIVPDFDETMAVFEKNDGTRYPCYDCLENKFTELCPVETKEKLKELKQRLGCGLQKEQGLQFCGEEEYPCQKYWNSRLLWTLVMSHLLDADNEESQKVILPIDNGDDQSPVYGEFLCAEGDLADLLPRMIRSFRGENGAENTIFFLKSDENTQMYYDREFVGNQIDDICRAIRSRDERNKIKAAFHLIKGDEKRADWAILAEQELISCLRGCIKENRIRKKLIKRLEELWEVEE